MAGGNVTASGGQVVCTADDVVDVGSDEGQTVVDALLWVRGRWLLSCWDLVFPLATACALVEVDDGDFSHRRASLRLP